MQWSAYRLAQEYLLPPHHNCTGVQNTLNYSKEQVGLEGERAKLNETLNSIIKSIAGTGSKHKALVVEPGEDLSDALFDDLETIGLSTAESEAIPEATAELLPEELFDDLAEEDQDLEK